MANNTGSQIKLSYDESNVPPVTYNGNKYKVSDVSIYAGSYFLFNGKTPKGMIIVEHKPIAGGSDFMVVIPIVSGTSYLPNANILTKIINETANLAPKAGNKSVISVDNYNLNSFVPKKPFYSFIIPDPGGGKEIIAYGIEHAIIIDDSTITKLNTIIKPISEILPASLIDKLFYNSKGPSTDGSGSSDDIYIDCQPVNVSEETIQMSTENKLSEYYQMGSDYDAKNTFLMILFNPWFQLLLLIFIIVLFYYFIQYLLKLGDVTILK